MGASEVKSGDIGDDELESNMDKEIILKDNAKYGEFDQLFSKFDSNTDGSLDEVETIAAIKHYSYVRPEFKNELNDLLNEMESGKTINKQDFRDMMSVYTGAVDFEENIIDVFKTFDKNLTGKLDTPQICHVFGKIGLNLNEEQGQKLLVEADKDFDKNIDFYEFIKIILSK